MWAARDKDGGIQLFASKPYYWAENTMWMNDCAQDRIGCVWDVLPELTFENSPKEVELKIKEK